MNKNPIWLTVELLKKLESYNLKPRQINWIMRQIEKIQAALSEQSE